MPRAFDTRAPIALWDPNRSDLNSNVQQHLDLGDLLLTGIEHLIDIILEEFGKLIGFDFTQFLTDLHQVFNNLKLLFGELNPLSGEFNPIAAVMTFFELIKESLITLPMDIIEGLPLMLAGFLSDHPILEQIVSAITDTIDGGLVAIEKFFGNLFNVIPVGAITAEQPNLLPAGAFPADSLQSDDPAWSIDTGNTMTADSTGSLKLLCDGKFHAVRSGRDRTDYIKVAAGQTVKASINVTSMDYAGTGADNIQLQLVPFYQPTTSPFVTHGDPITIAHYSPLPGDAPDWPGVTMTDTWLVTENVIGVQLRLLVTSGAQGGSLNFDNVSVKQTGLIAQEHISGLGSVIQSLISRIQVVIDAIYNAFTGSDSFLHSMEELALALLNIPFGNIIGVGGPTNIGDSIMAFLDSLLGGLVGTPGTGGGLADVFNISYIVSSMANLGKLAWELLGIRNNEPVSTGLLPTGDANYPYANANTYLAVTQSASLCITYRAGRSAPLGVVSWLGHTSTGITGFYVNIRKIDAATGARELVHHSPNIVANLPAGAGNKNWVFYELAEPLPRLISDEYEIQLVPVGGTHYVKGYDTADSIPDHPNAQVLAPAAVRNETTPTAPTQTIAKASVTTSTKVMWIETAIDTGNATGYFDPVTVYLTENTSVPIPFWADYIDGIALGGGGGGRSGGTAGLYGEPGTAGKWAMVTWERGVHYDTNSDTSVVFTCGAGGSGGVALVHPAGGAGGPSTLALTCHTLTAAGGTGGTNLLMGLASHYPGQAAGTRTFNDQPYVGGGEQYTYGTVGAAPGGGGCGGNWVNFQPGGPGAVGGGWVRFRQGAIEGGGDIPDTTPPTPPTIVLDAETYTSITVTATGSVDS